MRVIEAQAVWCDKRSGLLDMRSQRVSQDGVQNMSAGVVGRNPAPPFLVDSGLYFVAGVDFAEIHFNLVNNDSA